jgi:1-acyl-sn-glycerol-3-phosphate acyltransferase
LFRKKAIDEWALDYWLLQRYARLCFRIYYRKIEVVNRHNIPLNEPIILAPNHQNALMDAMVLVCNMPFQSVFLARADIFKGKRLIRFLTFANIMPIYRMRDGIENVKRNDAVFEKTLQVLHNKNNPLGLFAEGNHGDKRRLRQLVKGLFRIAFLAQEKYDTESGVKIIPIGIDYGHYRNFRSTLFVNIGEPIEVSDFYGVYRDNPVMAINQLKEAFAAALSKQMIDIQTDEYYDLYMYLREIFNDEMKVELEIQDNSLAGKFWADKVMIDNLNRELEAHPDEISQLNTLVLDYQAGIKKARLRDWVLKKDKYAISGLMLSAITKLVLLPVFIFGFLNNYLPYWFTASKIKNIKDTQFQSSFKYVIGMIVFPVWYIVLAGILAFMALPIWLILLYIILLPLTGLAAFDYYIRFKKFVAKCRYNNMKSSHEMNILRNVRKSIFKKMHDIINMQKPANDIDG